MNRANLALTTSSYEDVIQKNEASKYNAKTNLLLERKVLRIFNKYTGSKLILDLFPNF